MKNTQMLQIENKLKETKRASDLSAAPCFDLTESELTDALNVINLYCSHAQLAMDLKYAYELRSRSARNEDGEKYIRQVTSYLKREAEAFNQNVKGQL
jgi:hypothetical protein